MPASVYPLLYQVNTRVWLTELSKKSGRSATLDDIPDNELDKFANAGFEWIWFLSVWQTGEEGKRLSRSNPEWMKEFHETIPDLKEEDIPGSGFAITRYTVHEELGGDAALARLRKRLQDRGLKLMLDFVPNHTAPDHEWVQKFPNYYIRGNETLLANEPKNYKKIKTASGEVILAYGRDPYFPGWPDTLQLNYSKPELQEARINELIKISGQCDGVRCDMAMLVLPEVFEKTWGLPCRSFWPEATKRVREHNPDFKFMAEVYWDLEWTLQQQGFDYTYDKRLYDRLKEVHAKPVRGHLYADMDYQRKMARFLENHDEPRAAAEFADEVHEAAAILTFFSMGLRFFHQGQFEGKKKRISPHLGRGPIEPVNERLQKFYQILLTVLQQPVFRNGNWKLLECAPAWDGNRSHDNYICFAWETNDGNNKSLVVVNYSPEKSQCYLKLSFTDLAGKNWLLQDKFSVVKFERSGDDLQLKGLYLDEPGWKYYVFVMNLK
jgi:glycosidase